MNRGHMQLIGADPAPNPGHADPRVADSLEASLEELVRRARLQAGELSLIIQRLERLRSDIRRHLSA
jgi:hypothetical protein